MALTSADARTVLHEVAHGPGDVPALVDLDVLDTAQAMATLVRQTSHGWPDVPVA